MSLRNSSSIARSWRLESSTRNERFNRNSKPVYNNVNARNADYLREERHAIERLFIQADLCHFQKILDEINAMVKRIVNFCRQTRSNSAVRSEKEEVQSQNQP